MTRSHVVRPPSRRLFQGVLALVAFPLFASAWQTAPPAPACKAAGQAFGWDPLAQTLTLKSDSGLYSDFRYDSATTFNEGTTSFRPDELGVLQSLNIDDRLCVQSFRSDAPDIASVIKVTARARIDAADEQEILRWQADSFSGVIQAIDRAAHTMTVTVSPSSVVTVDTSGPVQYWNFPASAEDPADTVRSTGEALTPGQAVYVRGGRTSGSPNIQARLIVSGGLRTFAGSIESMDPLNSLLHLRDLRTGRSRLAHFDFSSIDIVGKATAAGSRARQVFPGTLGDLEEKDAVLIFGKEDQASGMIQALLLVTGFSPGGILQPGPGQSPDWIFEAVGFGASRP